MQTNHSEDMKQLCSHSVDLLRAVMLKTITKRMMFAGIVIAMCIVSLVGCGKTAEPISLPASVDVTKIDIETPDGARISFNVFSDIEQIVETLNGAEPTRTPSVNDQPTNVDAYGRVSIDSGGETTVLYYYDRDGRHFVEQPYAGIYELKQSFEEAVPKEKLTAEALAELSKKGDELSWGDFIRYEGRDVGSGLVILRFDMDGGFYVLVGGSDMLQPPSYIRLCADKDADGVDVREGKIEDYMDSH